MIHILVNFNHCPIVNYFVYVWVAWLPFVLHLWVFIILNQYLKIYISEKIIQLHFIDYCFWAAHFLYDHFVRSLILKFTRWGNLWKSIIEFHFHVNEEVHYFIQKYFNHWCFVFRWHHHFYGFRINNFHDYFDLWMSLANYFYFFSFWLKSIW